MNKELDKILVIDDNEMIGNKYIEIGEGLIEAPCQFKEVEKSLRNKKYPMLIMDYEFSSWGPCNGEKLVKKIKNGDYGNLNQNSIFINNSSHPNKETVGKVGKAEKKWGLERNPKLECYNLKNILEKYLPEHAKYLKEKHVNSKEVIF